MLFKATSKTKGMEIPKMMPQQTQVPGPNETRIDLRGKLLSSKRRFWSLYIPVFAVEMNPSLFPPNSYFSQRLIFNF